VRPARVQTAAGALVGREEWPSLLAELSTLVGTAEREQRVLAERREIARRPLWLKGDHLPGSARTRHSLRRWFGLPTPREREAENLLWLRERLFRAPQPLACAALVRGGLVRYQLLVLAPLPPHEPLELALASASPARRGTWLAELAREVARMHSLHFAHRDLFLRNVLVVPSNDPGDRRELLFTDGWHGQFPWPRRGADHDLACLMLEGADLLAEDEQRSFFALYLEQRRRQDKAAEPRALLRAVTARRRELVRRLQTSARRRPPPRVIEWDAARLL
jgi:hypothetical protein